MTLLVVLGLVAAVAVVVVLAVVLPPRVLGESQGVHTSGHEWDGVETEERRDHTPGGGTGGL